MQRLLALSRPLTRQVTALSLVIPAALALAIHAAGAAGSATLYVGPAGSGTSCTTAAPCSLGTALTLAQTGDTVSLDAGTYDGSWAVTAAISLVGAGASTTILDGGHTATVLVSDPGDGTVSIRGMTIRNGAASACFNESSGGGLCVASGALSILDDSFTGDAAASDGGAIDVGDGISGAALTVSRSVFADDTAGTGGGAIDAGSGGGATLSVTGSTFETDSSAGVGGAIDVGAYGGVASATIGSSTFDDDSASLGGGALSLGMAGSASTTIIDATFAHDTAPSGGAIDNADEGTAVAAVQSSTFVGDSPAGNSALGNALFAGVGTLALEANVFGATQPSGTVCAGSVTDYGGNVSDAASCALTDPSSVGSSAALDAYLGSLGHNGGATETVPLLAAPTFGTPDPDPALAEIPASMQEIAASSSGVSHIATSLCDEPDQRDVARGRPCDSGSFELHQSAVSVSSVTTSPVVGEPLQLMVDVSGAGGATGTPSGSVVVSDSTGHSCTVDLASATSCQLAENAAGRSTFVAAYSGDRDFSSALSAPDYVSITRASSAVALRSPTSDPSLPGTPVVLLAKVTVLAPGSATIAGSMTFRSGSRLLCAKVRVSLGAARCKAALTLSTTQRVTATYLGSSKLAPSSANIHRHVELGYLSVTSTGRVTAHGDASSHGSLPSGSRAIGIAMSKGATGYWIAEPNGTVASFGTAPVLGDLSDSGLRSPIVGIVATPTGDGYFLVEGDGAITGFGKVPFPGSAAPRGIGSPVVSMSLLPAAAGYDLAESDGTVLVYSASTRTVTAIPATLSRPVSSIAVAGSKGYWLLESNGSVLAKNGAPLLGGCRCSVAATALLPTADRGGYWIVFANGAFRAFGDAVVAAPTTTSPGTTVAATGM